MEPPVRRPVIAASALAAGALILLAACGGSSSSNAGSKSTSTLASNSTVKATKGGDFCKQVASTYNETAALSKNLTGTADSIRQNLATALKDGQAAIDNAPAEVKPDLQIIQDAVKSFTDALAKVDYDASRLGADLLGAVSAFNTPQFQQATVRSQTYVSEKCGIQFAPTTSTP